jgi:hypothetical protein
MIWWLMFISAIGLGSVLAYLLFEELDKLDDTLHK